MTQEAKAKAYDKAIEKVRQYHNENCDACKMCLESIFDELNESERIRKALIAFIKKRDRSGCDYDYDKWIAWLEKQGEIDKASYEIAEKEKREFVGDGFIKCYAGFQDFKEGETYWLEYIGNDNYNVRSDNLLGKTYHITPCQLYTIFKKQTWLEKQGQKFQYWKPSEEQLEALDYAYNLCPDTERGNYYEGVLETIIDDLHKFSEKQAEHKQDPCEQCKDKRLNCHNFPCIDKIAFEQGKTALEVIKEEVVNNANKVVVESKFKVGDWLVANKPNNYAHFIQILEVVNVYEKERYKISRDFHNNEDVVECRFIEKYYHSFTIQDAKDGDVLSDGTTIFIFKDLLSDDSVISYCDYDTDSGESDAFCPLSVNLICSKITLATKEQRDLLFQKIHEAGYEWNAEKKELKKVEPKFKKGDWIIYRDEGCTEILRIIGVTGTNYLCIDISDDYCRNLNINFIDSHNYRLWTIQDAKQGDVLEFGDHGRIVTGILSFVNKNTGKVDVCCLLEGDKFKVGVFYNLDTVKPHPATKEQRDLLFQKMKEAGYEWDSTNKQLLPLTKHIYEDD